MTTVTDLNDGDVEVVEGKDEDALVGGGESVSPTWPRLDALRDSVVARLLMDSRPPRLHTAACPSTTRCPTVGSDVVRELRSLPPPVDLSAGKSVSYIHYDDVIFALMSMPAVLAALF